MVTLFDCRCVSDSASLGTSQSITFLCKDGVTTLYSLADFYDEDGVKIRKDENFEKNYLLGKYGAIPDLKAIDLF